MLTEANREQFKKNFQAGWKLNGKVLPWVIVKIIDSLPVKEEDCLKCKRFYTMQPCLKDEECHFIPDKSEHFQPTVRHCEYCRHQGDCSHKDECSRAYRQKDYYQKR